jgi:hypothetical protein
MLSRLIAVATNAHCADRAAVSFGIWLEQLSVPEI